MTKTHLGDWRTRVIYAIWGRSKFRCHEILFTLLTRGHAVDPVQARALRILKSARRMLLRYPQAHHTWWAVMRVRQQRGSRIMAGPVNQFLWALRQMDWRIVTDREQFHVITHEGDELDFLQCDQEFLEHAMREGLRFALWKQGAARRDDMRGAEVGIDRNTSMKLLGKLRGRERRMLQRILIGSVVSRERAYRARWQAHPTCLFCNAAEETVEHIFCHCPKWAHLRAAELQDEALPACTRLMGLAVENPQLRVFERSVGQAIYHVLPYDHSVENDRLESRDEQGRVIVFTDGACKRQGKHPRLRCAGIGVFFGSAHHPANVSTPLMGRVQTNQRAELQAVVTAAARDHRHLHIKTDSAFVVGGFERFAQWQASGWQGSHGDLWAQLQVMLESAPGRLHISKVKGHASWLDVRMGRSTLADKTGNDAADKLAVAGSNQHPAAIVLQRQCEEASEKCSRVQRSLLDIALAREEALRNMPEEAMPPPPPLPRRHRFRPVDDGRRRRRLR